MVTRKAERVNGRRSYQRLMRKWRKRSAALASDSPRRLGRVSRRVRQEARALVKLWLGCSGRYDWEARGWPFTAQMVLSADSAGDEARAYLRLRRRKTNPWGVQ